MLKRYVKIVKDTDLIEIENYVTSSKYSYSVRRRSQGILLSHRGFSVQEIRNILQVSLPTIYDWMNRYESQGVCGLLDKSRSGRPLSLSESEQKKI